MSRAKEEAREGVRLTPSRSEDPSSREAGRRGQGAAEQDAEIGGCQADEQETGWVQHRRHTRVHGQHDPVAHSAHQSNCHKVAANKDVRSSVQVTKGVSRVVHAAQTFVGFFLEKEVRFNCCAAGVGKCGPERRNSKLTSHRHTRSRLNDTLFPP